MIRSFPLFVGTAMPDYGIAQSEVDDVKETDRVVEQLFDVSANPESRAFPVMPLYWSTTMYEEYGDSYTIQLSA